MTPSQDRLRAMQAQCALRKGWVHTGCPCLHYFQCRVPTEEDRPVTPDESMRKFLVGLGATCRCKGRLFVLDGFDHEFYLTFDAERDADDQDAMPGTCDIYMVAVGEGPVGGTKFRVLPNATRHKVMRFLFALGVNRFSEPTRKFLYENNSVPRAD